jgi:hypothetical protein
VRGIKDVRGWRQQEKQTESGTMALEEITQEIAVITLRKTTIPQLKQLN